MQKARFQIEGMTCQACATRIEKVLNRQQSVSSASVNFAGEEAQVHFDDSQLKPADIVGFIQKAGYDAKPIDEHALPQLGAMPKFSARLALEWLITLPFLVGMVGMFLGRHDWMLSPIWQFVLASIMQWGLAWPFYKGAWASIKGGLANMDVLVSLGTLSIWLYSSYMLFAPSDMNRHGHIYFEASVMVIAFVSLGKYLEARTKKQSLNSMGLLLKLTPQMVRKQNGSAWESVPLDQVHVNDILQVNAGERVAADGAIERGEAWVDESHLTGESRPLLKTVGDTLLAGALVTDGSVVYQAHSLGSKTLLGDMMAALAEAQGSKAPIARLADKVAAVFVPVVLAIAVLTFVLNAWLTTNLNDALMRAVAVLVIACPCALGLATPAAIMVGMGKAAGFGVWFKDAASMERASKVNTVILDKTGTLTTGQPQVVAQWLPEHGRLTAEDVWRISAAVESLANHPLAQAIVAAAQQKELVWPTAAQSHSETGQGIAADVQGFGVVKVGQPKYVSWQLPEQLQTHVQWQSASVVAVSLAGEVVGAFALADTLKADSLAAVRRLQKQGMDVHIMSGDHLGVVQHVAEQLDIGHYQAEMSPRDKAQAVEALMKEGKVVAMVGDGVNDAPALAAADVSFAMYGGADVAAHTASATLMQHSVNQVADALALAQDTVRNIKQNLFFAFFYNILGIPLAAMGWLSPVIAGAAMALSSISVLGNALRLKNSRLSE